MRHTLSILLILLGINPIIAQTSLSTNSATICSGGNATVTATNLDQTVTFSWTSPPLSIPGATLNLTNVSQTGTWTCETYSNNQLIDTDIFTVTVNNVSAGALSQTQTICSGGDANPFTVTTAATGTGTLSYQWQSSNISAFAGFTDIVGATNATYDPPAGQTLTTYFRLIVTSTLNGIVCNSTSAVLTVFVNNISPSVITNSQTICSGGNPVAFTVTTAATGTGTLSYQWQSSTTSAIAGFSNIIGATNSTYDPPAGITVSTYYQVITSSTLNNITCNATSNPLTVTVAAVPFILNNSTFTCSGNPFTISPTNGAGNTVPSGTTYSWTNPTVTGGITGGSAQNNQANISQTLTNPTNIQQTATYIVTPTSGAAGSCQGANFTLVVTINPIPSIPPQNSSACSGTTFTYNPQNNLPTTIIPNGTTYTWTQPIVTGNITGGSAQNNQATISQTLTNPTNTQQIAIYTVIPTSGAVGACPGSSFSLTVVVNPTPVIPNQTQTICSNSAFLIALQNNPPSTLLPNGTTYSWTNPIVTGGITGGSEQNNQANILQTLTNPTNSTQTATYTVFPTSGAVGVCPGSSFSVAVVVNPTPLLPNQTQTICSNSAFLIALQNNPPSTLLPNGTTYSWTNPTVTGGITGGSAQNNQANISQTLTNPTNVAQTATYTVTPLSGICQGNNFQLVVTVKPLPMLTPSASQTICGGTPTTLTSFTISVAGGTISWTLSNPLSVPGTVTGYQTSGNGQIPVSTINNGGISPYTLSYQVTPTANGCSGSAGTYSITVNPLPNSTINPNGATTFCSGGSVTLSAMPNYSSYTWNKDGIVIPGAASATYFATQSGVYSVSIINQYSCNSNGSIVVNNLTIPVAAVSNASPANFFCQGDSTTLNASANCQGCNLSYQWLVNGANTPGTNPSLSVIATGNYSVVIGNSLNGIACLDTSNNIFITSVQIVPPSFTVLPDSICVNESFVLPQLSNNNIVGTWNPLTISNQSSSYTFTPLQGQCASPYSWNVQLVALPQPSLGNDLVICAGDSTILISQGFNSYLWSNGSSDSSITVAPSATTQYILSVSNSLGCVGADSINVAVNPVPPLPFISGSESLCLNSLNQVYSTTPTVNWLIWNIDGATIYSGQYTNEVHLDLTSTDTLLINLTEHVLNTGCYSTNTLMVLVDTNASAPPYVNVLPLGNQNDFLCAPQAGSIFRWGKIDKNTNDIYFYPSVYTYHNFTALDTANYFYFVDHGEIGCFTRSYYVYPQLITSTEELSSSTYWISPNPVINELSINSTKTELVWVNIENLEGKLVFKEEVWTNNPINCISFIPGMYFVKIEKAAELNFVKFLKF